MIFIDEIKDMFIFHIPHSSISIPIDIGYISEDVMINEMIKMTDWATDLIFEVDDIDKIRTPFSRIFCDVERFNSDKEHMNSFGRGVIYTKTEDGNDLRKIDNKEHIIDYYNTHHKKLEELIEYKLSTNPKAYIIDCHSFPNIPISGEIQTDFNRPDICIGFDENNCDSKYSDLFINYFKNIGYKVSVNTPFSGSIVPLKYIGDNRVQSVMIEINRDLYMENDNIITKEVIKLNRIITKFFDEILI